MSSSTQEGGGTSAHPTAPHEHHGTRLSDIDWLRRWSKQRWGNAFHSDHRELLGKRLQDASKSLSIPIAEIRNRAEEGADTAIVAALGDAVSVNYTEFFREPDVLARMVDVVFPALPNEGPLRFWSAAASSGEEAYSLAMLALEQLGDASARVRILGTDLSPRNVAAAEAGRYASAVVHPIGPTRLGRFMKIAPDGSYSVAAPLPEMCLFRRLNLQSTPWPFRMRFNLILLRNVLYYFDPETRATLLQRCHAALEPKGFLITSLTEPLSSAVMRPDQWQRVAPAIYRKRP